MVIIWFGTEQVGTSCGVIPLGDAVVGKQEEPRSPMIPLDGEVDRLHLVVPTVRWVGHQHIVRGNVALAEILVKIPISINHRLEA